MFFRDSIYVSHNQLKTDLIFSTPVCKQSFSFRLCVSVLFQDCCLNLLLSFSASIISPTNKIMQAVIIHLYYMYTSQRPIRPSISSICPHLTETIILNRFDTLKHLPMQLLPLPQKDWQFLPFRQKGKSDLLEYLYILSNPIFLFYR